MLNYEILEESFIDANDQWKKACNEMSCECNNQYNSIMMAKINNMPYDYKRITSSITHFGWESNIADEVVVETIEDMIHDTVKSPFIDGEIAAYYSGKMGIEDFLCIKQRFAVIEWYNNRKSLIKSLKEAELEKMKQKLSLLESQIQQIVKEVLEYREDSWIHSAINLSILVRYVRGQLLIRETQAVMEVCEILDPEVLSTIIKRYVPECHQLV